MDGSALGAEQHAFRRGGEKLGDQEGPREEKEEKGAIGGTRLMSGVPVLCGGRAEGGGAPGSGALPPLAAGGPPGPRWCSFISWAFGPGHGPGVWEQRLPVSSSAGAGRSRQGRPHAQGCQQWGYSLLTQTQVLICMLFISSQIEQEYRSISSPLQAEPPQIFPVLWLLCRVPLT